jgi:predicted AlkP superfamily pyrophosphatase or phosphodiesterase
MPRTALIVAVIFMAALLAILTPAKTTPIEASIAPVRPTITRIEHDPSVVIAAPQVKLAVFVIFDQMRGDYLPRWKPHFGKGGFSRMMDEGAWYSDCHYAYGTTTTGPGHASLLAGATSQQTGIINNEWYDRDAGIQVYCAGSDRFENVSSGGVAVPKKTRVDVSAKKPKGSGTPERCLSPNVADQVKAAKLGKVFGVSLKDRSAIFPSGHQPDGAYWFTAEFITSTFYRDSLPKWVRDFNAAGLAKSWYGKTWSPLRPDLDYAAIVGNSSTAGVANRAGLGLRFPHPITGGKSTLTSNYYEALITSPFGNDLVLAFSKACITGEKLGQGAGTDLLAISFSSNDLVGHAFGPDSPEVLDTTLRSDRIMAELMTFLDDRVGKGKYCIVMSADHGICPLPEVSTARGLDAKRVIPTGMILGAERHLQAAYGKPIGGTAVAKPGDDSSIRGNFNQWIEALSAPWVYLNHRQIAAKGLTVDAVADTLAASLRTVPEVARVYTRKQLIGDMSTGDGIDRLVQASYEPTRAGDLYVLLKPYYLLSSPLQGGTTHGTPYDYDTHVPLVIYGPGLVPGEKAEAISPQHSAAIMSRFLGLKPPRDNLFDVPAGLFK